MKTFNEKIEKEVGNIIGRNCEKMIIPDAKPIWYIKDLESIMFDLMEYIENVKK